MPLCLAAIFAFSLADASAGQQPTSPPRVSTASGGVVQGVVTTQNGTIQLGGVFVSLATDRTSEVATVISEADGSFRFEGVRPGRYQVTAVFEGFETRSAVVEVAWNQIAQVPIDLRVAAAERVDVVAVAGALSSADTLTTGEVVSSDTVEQMGPSGLQAALRLIVAAIEVPGGVSIKGGRPSQSTVQLGAGTFVDPATGLSQVRLPDDAIDTVKVLPNPYAVEFGRFSSGLVLIQTRRAGDRWKTRLNNLDPSFRTRRGRPFDIEGLLSFAPRLEIGGPIKKDRLFLQQSAQYRYRSNDIPSRPPTELQTSHAFSSFTRLDANLAPRHSLVAVGGFFPSIAKQATLGTFIPPEASADIEGRHATAAISERTLWGTSLFSETTFEVNTYRNEVQPQGRLPMELLPEVTLGNFYNRQRRSTTSYQVIETVSGTTTGEGSLHLYKVGIDLLYNRFEGLSTSGPVVVRRSDGTLARRLDFGPGTRQSIDSADLAVFAQDRWQPTNRWYVEFGGRLDHDGVINRWNFTPRTGTAVLLNPSGTAVLRGGVGFFFERTPSAAGAFNDYESYVETRYAADGITPLGPPVQFVHRTADDLRTSRSLTWDLAYDHRFNRKFAIRFSTIDRDGSHELIVDPVNAGDSSAIELYSRGRSRYREAEFGVHYTAGTRVDVNTSYVRSMARADLNGFTSYFDVVRAPVFGQSSYAAARTEVPHRLLVRGRVMPTPRWLFVGVLDWRSGLPYSVVDAALDFVGPRNDRRFPTYVRLELGVEHRFKILGFQPWVGLRADNALNAWLPIDVQANIDSPAFGTYYNSEYRQFRVTLRFAR
jgi:hypothetical protein